MMMRAFYNKLRLAYEELKTEECYKTDIDIYENNKS